MAYRYMICCESTADLSEEHFLERDIPFACFTFHMDGVEYKDDYGHSMDVHTFYQRMREGSVSTTSQVSVGAYEALWKPYLEAGQDILHITLSSGISGTYNSAMVAAEEMRESFPERKVLVLDSRTAAGGYGMLVDMAWDRREAGAELEPLYKELSELRHHINIALYTTELTYLWRGGRLSKTAFVLGSALKVCPVLRINEDGKLVAQAKCRGKKRAMDACLQYMKQRAEGGAAYDGYCYINHSEMDEDAAALAAAIEESFPKLKGKVQIFNIGMVIGSHTGPGAIAVFFAGARKEP